MVLVAEAAVWLLRPRPAPIAPAPTQASDWFTGAQIERGQDFDRGQDWLYLAGIGVEAIVLIVLATGRPQVVRRALTRATARPLAGTAIVGAGVSVVVAVVTLPIGLAAHDRAVDYGLSVQGTGSWLADAAKSTVIGALVAGVAAAVLGALVRRLPRAWWIPGAGATVAIAAAITWIAPVVLAPLFNKFEKLPPGNPARAEVLRLAHDAGVKVGGVYRVNASRKVRALNAYVDGIGSTRRVVLYDNLISGTDHAERRPSRAARASRPAHPAPSPPTSSRSRSPPLWSASPATSSRARSRRAPTPSRSTSLTTREPSSRCSESSRPRRSQTPARPRCPPS